MSLGHRYTSDFSSLVADRTYEEARQTERIQQQPCGRDQRSDDNLRGGHGRAAEGHHDPADVRFPRIPVCSEPFPLLFGESIQHSSNLQILRLGRNCG